MRASELSLSSLTTYEDHLKAISMIEEDYRNIVGNYDRWVSGYKTELNATAKKKIAAIEKRIDRLFPCSEGGW